MNAFLALRLADAPRDALARVSERLQEWNLPAAWVHPEDYHLTMVFLGRLDDDEVSAVPAAIDLVAGALRCPRLRFAGLGASGGRNEPRVVYAALADADHQCEAMHRDLCEALGVEDERDFLPHVTVCRPRPRSPREKREQPLMRDWPHLLEAHGLADWGECPTTHLVLYRSQPERTPRYHELARWELA